MLDTTVEKMGEHIANAAHRASRAGTAVSEAVEECLGTTKRVVKSGCDAAEEFMDDTQQRIKRHPLETVVAAFAAGTAVGLAIGYWLRRK